MIWGRIKIGPNGGPRASSVSMDTTYIRAQGNSHECIRSEDLARRYGSRPLDLI